MQMQSVATDYFINEQLLAFVIYPGAVGKAKEYINLIYSLVKLPAWKVEDGRFKPHSGLQVSKKQNVSSRALIKIQYCGEPP